MTGLPYRKGLRFKDIAVGERPLMQERIFPPQPETKCAVSGKRITFELDSELSYRVRPPAQNPVFFVPLIDLPNLDAPCIVDDF